MNCHSAVTREEVLIKTNTLFYASRRILAICAVLIYSARLFAGDHEQPDLDKLVHMSLEELMEVRVTSVSRKPERLVDTASAVYVVTQDDIRRSGALSIPEALRYVPGLQVARVDGNKWAISARGGNGLFANRLLVLMDGRTLYTPLFSGVWWDVQDTLMDDIDRIEIIRGPGAAMWGANAVNGVINIITKQARDTQGVAVNVAGGNKENGRVSARFGTKLGEQSFLRVYGSRFYRNGYNGIASYAQGSDDQEQQRGGFRLDSDMNNNNHLTVQGDVYGGDSGGGEFVVPLAAFPYGQRASSLLNVDGQNVLGRWSRSLSPTSNFALQLFWDRTNKIAPYLGIAQEQHTYDIDFQHTFDYGDYHHIVWGGGYRVVHSTFKDRFFLQLGHPNTNKQIFNFFVQDEITLIPERLRLTIGSKFEHNDYTGMEPQPSARLLWTPAQQHSIWAAISRAVRIPALVEDKIRFNMAVLPNDPPIVFSALQLNSPTVEELIAAELGYRTRWSDSVSLDIAGYYHMYNDINYAASDTCRAELVLDRPNLNCPFVFTRSKNTGAAYGIEVAADAHVIDGWRLRLGYTYQQVDYGLPAGSLAWLTNATGSTDPKHQFYLRSSVDLPHDVFFDLGLRYVDHLQGFSLSNYVTLDARLAWKPRPNVEFALVGQNMIEEPHQEFGAQVFFPAVTVTPSYFAQVRLQF